MIFVSCLTGFAIAWHDEVSGSIISTATHFKSLYTSTIVRMNSWLLGGILGYILFKTRGQTIKLSKITVLFLWFMSLSMMLIIMFSQVYFFRTPYNRLISSLYIGFSRAIWSTGLCWIIFACVHGYGGFVNKFLSMRAFIVLGRLTYTMYLTHIAILFVILGSGEVNTRFSNYNSIHQFWGDLVMTLIVSLMWSLAFESPIIAVGHIVIPEKLKKKLTEISNENGNARDERNISHSTHL
ncbi:uncharacterized protein CBL_01292 [Carabus blaptoides fortunei]